MTAKKIGTPATCLMCGAPFVRKRVAALNCSKRCSQRYSNYRAGRVLSTPAALADEVAMDRAWRFALSEMRPPCN